MKKMLALTSLLFLSASCVDNQGAGFLRFTNTRVITPGDGTTCAAENTSFRPRGVLDLAGNSSYLIAPSLESNAAPQLISINGENFSGKGLSDITVYEIVYSYSFADSSVNIALPKEESVPYYAVIRPQTDAAEAYLLFYSIGPKALTALQNYFRGRDRSQSATVISNIKARAYLSGSEKFESNIFHFPTTVYWSGFAGCTDPAAPIPVTLCGAAGQDGDASCVGK